MRTLQIQRQWEESMNPIVTKILSSLHFPDVWKKKTTVTQVCSPTLMPTGWTHSPDVALPPPWQYRLSPTATLRDKHRGLYLALDISGPTTLRTVCFPVHTPAEHWRLVSRLDFRRGNPEPDGLSSVSDSINIQQRDNNVTYSSECGGKNNMHSPPPPPLKNSHQWTPLFVECHSDTPSSLIKLFQITTR